MRRSQLREVLTHPRARIGTARLRIADGCRTTSWLVAANCGGHRVDIDGECWTIDAPIGAKPLEAYGAVVGEGPRHNHVPSQPSGSAPSEGEPWAPPELLGSGVHDRRPSGQAPVGESLGPSGGPPHHNLVGLPPTSAWTER